MRGDDGIPEGFDVEGAKRFLAGWRAAGPMNEAERRRRIRETDTAANLHAYDGLVEEALRVSPPGPTSGLLELKRLLAKAEQGGVDS
ncbi:MAG: hypothetical protein AAF078_06900 [Planctomycetota bacterium]